MPLRLRRAPARALAWGLFVALCAIDLAIASQLSLGLLYVLPLALAALLLPRAEALTLAVGCAAAAFLLGPVGDPLGLTDATLHLRRELEAPIGGTLGLIAFVSLALLLSRAKERRGIEKLDEELDCDPLTGLANRRGLERFLAERLAAKEPISVLALDLDHLDALNTRHGHDAGDRALRELSLRLLNELRGGDLVARTGGEEFVVVLPGLDAATARKVGERIRQKVRDRPFDVVTARVQLTVSIGAATGQATAALLGAADGALRSAKQAGCDRVEAVDIALLDP